MSTILKDCLKMATRVAIPNEKDLVAEIRAIDGEVAKLALLRKNLLGVERMSQDKPLARKIAELNSKARALAQTRLVGQLSGGLSQLSLEPLAWRDRQGWPKLVLFGLKDADFRLSVAGRYRGRDSWGHGYGGRHWVSSTTPKLPPVLADCYRDVMEKLGKLARDSKKSVHLTTTFVGLIPPEARQAIEKAKKTFKQVFILGEAYGWELKKTSIPRPRRDPCPLVVGFDGACLWLVHRFDVTTLENYVASEFRL